MKRQQESAEPQDQEEYEDERPTRIDIVRRQGEGQLRKVSFPFDWSTMMIFSLLHRCVNKSWLVSRWHQVERLSKKWSWKKPYRTFSRVDAELTTKAIITFFLELFAVSSQLSTSNRTVRCIPLDVGSNRRKWPILPSLPIAMCSFWWISSVRWTYLCDAVRWRGEIEINATSPIENWRVLLVKEPRTPVEWHLR